MEDEAATKRRRVEGHNGLNDEPGLSSFHMEDLPELPNSHSGLLQLAHYLAFAPQLETLKLHMMYHKLGAKCWQGEGTGEEASCIHRLDHLKTVYMSGFRCYRAQVELLCCILDKGPALEHVAIEPQVTLECAPVLNVCMPEGEIREWARVTSERFGKAITVAPHRPLGDCHGKCRSAAIKSCL